MVILNYVNPPPYQAKAGNNAIVVTSADGLKVALAGNPGNVLSSPNSGTWWINLSPANGTASGSLAWSALAMSADGTKLVAAIDNGHIYVYDYVATRWIDRTPDTGTASGNIKWNSIAVSSDGSKIAATVSNGHLYTSPDNGVTWVDRSAGNSPIAGARAWQAIVSSSDGKSLAAIVNKGHIYTSADFGATWLDRSPSSGPASGDLAWRSLALSSNGKRIVAVVEYGDIFSSLDFGVTWMISQNYKSDRTGATDLLTKDIKERWFDIAASSNGTRMLVITTTDSTNHGNPDGWFMASSDTGANWRGEFMITAGKGTYSDWAELNPQANYSVAASSDGTKFYMASTKGGLILLEFAY